MATSRPCATAITPQTCAFLVEPIQAEAGVILPPDGYLAAAAALCREHGVLFIADEIQTGLGRTGRTFAADYEAVKPDLVVIGKALSGGFYPVSAVAGSNEILELFEPGSHGSTFGGNPLACAVARTAMRVLVEERLAERSAESGTRLIDGLRRISSHAIREVRGRGLLVGVDLRVPARPYCVALAKRGILCKETHETVLRITPPLVIERDELDWALEQIEAVFTRDDIVAA